MTNQELANILHQIADQLEANNDNPYRVRAYRRAAYKIESFPEDLDKLFSKNFDLTQIKFIGKGIASHLREIITAGDFDPSKLRYSQANTKQLSRIAGLGAKRIHILRTQLQIYTKEQLASAIKAGALDALPGFNEKIIAKISGSLKNPKPYEKFFRLNLATRIIENLRKKLETNTAVKQITAASSYRRCQELVGNTDLIAITLDTKDIIESFAKYEEIDEICSRSRNDITVILRSGLQVTLRAVNPDSFAAALLYYTGRQAHFSRLKKIAKEKGLRLTKTGIYRGEKELNSTSESSIYETLGMQYIPPELRENRGEIDAAQSLKLPKLISFHDLKGDLHSHTNETDGVQPLEAMVAAAEELGYEYIAITDHSKRLAITNGLDEKRLLKQLELIDELQSKFKHIKILKGIEVDILVDGSLDLSNDVLKELDVRVCSIHSRFNLPEAEQTDRIIRAMDNRYFNILGHPTGRLITSRPPYPVNIPKILAAAKERGCFLELNSHPARLDLNDTYCLMAKKMGIKLAISSDAHSTREFQNIYFGICQARRGWLEPDDVINTRSWNELKKLLKR